MDNILESYFYRKKLPVKVGVFAVGLETYWPQFDGLKETLIAHHALSKGIIWEVQGL